MQYARIPFPLLHYPFNHTPFLLDPSFPTDPFSFMFSVVVCNHLCLLPLTGAGVYLLEPWGRANYQWLQHRKMTAHAQDPSTASPFLGVVVVGIGAFSLLLSAWIGADGLSLMQIATAALSSWMHSICRHSSPQYSFPPPVTHSLSAPASAVFPSLGGAETQTTECQEVVHSRTVLLWVSELSIGCWKQKLLWFS